MIRVALSLTCFAFVFCTPASADRLRSLLEKKFNNLPSPAAPGKAAKPGGTTRGLAPPSASSPANTPELPSELLVIRPNGKIDRVPVRKGLDRRSSNTPDPVYVERAAVEVGDTVRGVWKYISSIWRSADSDNPTVVQAGVLSAAASRTTRSTASPKRLAQTQTSRMRRNKAFGVVPDVYIVQFKDTVTAAQIDAVIKKYRLDVVGKIPALHMIYVKRRKPKPVRTRGLTSRAPSPSADRSAASKPTAQSVLNPPFLQEMRKEPGINAATVHSTISPKTTPRPTNTMVVDHGGRSYHWTWRPMVADDGNWGLKRMRLPPVWHILKSYRSRSASRPTTMGFLDSGFSWHDHLTYNVVHGLKPDERLVSTIPEGAECEFSHGTHVAGIAGAAHGRGRGIDGIVPDARIDAIPVGAEDAMHAFAVGVNGQEGQNIVLFPSAAARLMDYLSNNPMKDGAKRVINVSLGYNWRDHSMEPAEAAKQFPGGDLDEGRKSVVLSHQIMLQTLLKRFEKDTLFVVAAGNDSEGLPTALNAKWSSPFAYLALEESETFKRAPNFIVVEALNRNGRRASFSNRGGQVSAPGVDIMSTVGGRGSKYGMCDGTSQAAPHVAALAAILMEVAPEKSPAEIVEIIRYASIPAATSDTAPRVDALEAVVLARPAALKLLADLNADGLVDGADLQTYKRHRQAMTTVFKSTLGSYFFDLNNNGQIEDNEHWYPRIDLNGSGVASQARTDARCLQGRAVSDLDVIKKAWGGDRAFAQVSLELGLVPTASLSASSQRKPSSSCEW